MCLRSATVADLNLRRALVQQLQSLQDAGIGQMPIRPALEVANPEAAQPEAAKPASAIKQEPIRKPPAGAPVDTPTGPSGNIRAEEAASQRAPTEPTASPQPTNPGMRASEATTLEILQQQVAACTLCDELACSRTNTVFGVGNPNARLCFLGEAPGADEDRTGEPFVGRAGQLLDKIIEACTLTRSEVFILNILKCRPPGNRNPTPSESNNCRRFLLRQLELIQPQYLCCLGTVAAQNLLETTESIGRLRGRVHDYHGVNVVCTYHPAYLLRNPSAKRDTWEDMKMLMRLMGVEL